MPSCIVECGTFRTANNTTNLKIGEFSICLSMKNFTTTAVQINAIDAETFLSEIKSMIDAKFESAIALVLGAQPQQPASTNDEWLSRKDVAKMFGISTDTVDNWSKVGILNPYKRGRRVFFKRSEVELAPTPKSANRLKKHSQIINNQSFKCI